MNSSATSSMTVRPANTSIVLSALALVTLLAGRVDADDWPQWLGPRRDQVSQETGWNKRWPPGGPPRLWQKSIGSGYSGIVVAKGHLVLFHRVGDENIVESLDPETGKGRWRFPYATSFVDPYGYDGGPRCCPIVHRDRVFTFDPDGILSALELETGKKTWSREVRKENELDQNHFGTGASPLIEDGVIYLHDGGREFTLGTGAAFAFDAASGRQLWKTPNHGGSYASPSLATIHGKKHLFIFHRGGLSSLDPADGKERWMFRWHAKSFESVNAATPLVVDDLVLISATYGTGAVCLRVKADGSYEEVWKDSLEAREKILEIHWTPPNYLDGHVYGFSGRHSNGAELRCVELATGKVKWAWESELYRGSMMYSDGHFIALGELGDLFLLRLSPEEYHDIAVVPRILSRPAWTVPTLANGRLYLRDLEKLICLDLRVEEKPRGTGDPKPELPKPSGTEDSRSEPR
jgi:outer membrane protein assembly factor BamB